MSRPRFLADNDLNDQIVIGLMRREPTMVMVRLREVGLSQAPYPIVLEYAAKQGFVVVSHDVNTMRAAAVERVENRQAMSGLLLVHQRSPIFQTIEELILIGVATESAEWAGQIQFLPL